jgi:hypothetical protein
MKQRGKVIKGDLETEHPDDIKLIIEIDHAQPRLQEILSLLGDISKKDPTAFVSVRCSEFADTIEQDEKDLKLLRTKSEFVTGGTITKEQEKEMTSRGDHMLEDISIEDGSLTSI